MEHLLTESMSSDEMLKLSPMSGVRLLTYDQLAKMTQAQWDQMMRGCKALILLYMATPNYGHWTLVLHTERGWSFFDPYGVFIDDQLKWHNAYLGKFNNVLSSFLGNSVGKVYYNQYRLQGLFPSATCGKHVLVRMMKRDLSEGEYDRWIKKMGKKYGLNPDELVTVMVEGMRADPYLAREG